MPTTNRLGTLIIIVIAFIAIIISVLDLTGAIDTTGWLGNRISALTLLVVGALIVFLVANMASTLHMQEMQMGTLVRLGRQLEELTVRQAILDAVQLKDSKSTRVSNSNTIRLKGVDALPPPNSM